MISVDMTWPKYVLLIIYIFALIGTVAQVGKARKPLDSGAASFSVVFTGILIALVLMA